MIIKILNTKTGRMGVDGNDLENVVRNYEEEIISMKELIDSLSMFEESDNES